MFSAAEFRVSGYASRVSKQLAATAQTALSCPDSAVSSLVRGHNECCADSGATDHMFNKYKAFVSYHPLSQRICYSSTANEKHSKKFEELILRVT